ncbi:hypothetical protein Rhow_006024 [Rhodococcus wratislaviensis]|uniref:Uncharacterized protein n=1 Tax=Rhodococcus wratislaviensis TaxID=44752 RepID=A0A402C0B8_RHOWR|nr:hypothetical protein Rhow_006024 [Rhodococcus wratislaviensis]
MSPGVARRRACHGVPFVPGSGVAARRSSEVTHLTRSSGP